MRLDGGYNVCSSCAQCRADKTGRDNVHAIFRWMDVCFKGCSGF